MSLAKLTKLTNLLLSHLQDEQSVQKRLLGLLKAQEAAAVAGETDQLVSTTDAIEEELGGEGLRDRRRVTLMSAFGGEFGVPAKMLTIGSLIERLEERGVRTTGLSAVRTELKETLLTVRKLSRKLKVIARGHGEVLSDVLRILAGSDERAIGTGIMINAEV